MTREERDVLIGTILWALGAISIIALWLMFAFADITKQEEKCKTACKPLKVQEVQVDSGTFYYRLEDGRLLPSNDKSLAVGEEVCECSGRVIKLNDKDNE